MRELGPIAVAACFSAFSVVSRPASAGTMDPAFDRLFVACDSPAGTCPDDTAFRRIVNQYGFAIAPAAMYPARTTGFGGFQVSFQGTYTTIDAKSDAWQNGTRGRVDPSTGKLPARNTETPAVLQVYALNLRKGIPFGLELGATVGVLASTSAVVAGADVRWSLLEGFRTGVLGYLPDIAVAAGVRTLAGTPQLQLTVASFDVIASKPIPVADSSIVTPYAGYQFIRVFGDSGLVNLPSKLDPGYHADTFEATRTNRHRIVLGLTYRYEMVLLGAHFVTDAMSAAEANSGAEGTALAGMPRQSTFGFLVGTAF